MDLSGKKRPGGQHLSWFDLVLGIALFLLIFRAVLQAWPRFDRKEERTVRLEVAVAGLAGDLAAQLSVGQWVKDEPSGEFMGKIVRKESGADRTDLLLVLERAGTIRKREGIFFGREVVRAGQERKFHTFYLEFTGRINRVVVQE